MTDKTSRRALDTAFKLQVMKMVRQHQVCKDMNVVDSAVRCWLTQFDEEAADHTLQDAVALLRRECHVVNH